jgi:V8-like Glu-specific endopeptidase
LVTIRAFLFHSGSVPCWHQGELFPLSGTHESGTPFAELFNRVGCAMRQHLPKRIQSTVAAALVACGLTATSAAAAGPTVSTAQPAVARQSLIQRIAVFGSDDRIEVPNRYEVVGRSVGMLFNNEARTVCTAFCVGDSTIATAAHCLFKTAGETPPRVADFWFGRLNGSSSRDFARIAGVTTASTPQHVMAGSTQLSVRPPIDATRDWALVRLSRPLCRGNVLPIKVLEPDQIVREAEEQRLFQVAYHRDFANWRLAYSQPCEVARQFPGASRQTIAKDFTDVSQLILHKCDTGGASSGSPLLVETPDGPAVIGINVGTYVQSRVMMRDGEVLHRFKSETVANTGVSAAAFKDRISEFEQAQILPNGNGIRVIQDQLFALQLYDGAIDGTFGPQLRTAISNYEQLSKLPVTGLATTSLIRRLDSITGSVPKRTPPAIAATSSGQTLITNQNRNEPSRGRQ